MTNNKILILGDSPQAFYLACVLAKKGEDAELICNTSQTAANFIVKEDFSSAKFKAELACSFEISQAPKLLIIASSLQKYRADLSLLAPRFLKDTPVLCLLPLKDTNIVSAILKKECLKGFFDGIVNAKENSLSVFGEAPNIRVYIKDSEEDKSLLKAVKSAFSGTAINIRTTGNFGKLFWNFFIPYTLCFFLASSQKRAIFDILKNKASRENAKTVLSELISLAQADNAEVSEADLWEQIYNIPNSAIYPQISGSGLYELNYISRQIAETAEKSGCKIPTLEKSLKNLSNINIV